MDALKDGASATPVARVAPADVREEATALLALGGMPDVGFVTIERLLRAFGSGRRALAAPPSAFREAVGRSLRVGKPESWRLHAARETVDRSLRMGIDVVPRGADGYPERLLHLAQPPSVLFLRGDRSLLSETIVAVVGSRRSSAYGRRVAAEVSRVLAAHGVVVASGMALGVDAAAHRATLEAGASTVAVLGSGADVVHPPSNGGLFRRIARDGLLVTEFVLGTPPLPHHFPRRNRILAALATGVLVVEAAHRSGALITSDLALELGRNVMAVPGPVFAERSAGTNRLIREGASLLAEPSDVLELASLSQGPLVRRGDAGPARLGVEGEALWLALGGEGEGVDDLARRTGLGMGRTLAALAELELTGWVEREPGMRFVRRRNAGEGQDRGREPSFEPGAAP